MSEPMQYAYEQSTPDPTAKLVLIAIASHTNYETGDGAVLSEGTLSKETGLTAKTIREKVRLLEEAGFLFVTRREKRPSEYALFNYKGWRFNKKVTERARKTSVNGAPNIGNPRLRTSVASTDKHIVEHIIEHTNTQASYGKRDCVLKSTHQRSWVFDEEEIVSSPERDRVDRARGERKFL
jgi:hypothetical protein